MYRSALASGLLTFWSTLTNWQIIFKPLDGIFWKKNWYSCWWNVVLADVWVSIFLIYCKAVKKGYDSLIFFYSFLFFIFYRKFPVYKWKPNVFFPVYQQSFWTWKCRQNDTETWFVLTRVIFLLVSV